MSHSGRALAKDIILEILRQADARFRGKTRLYKTFYFAHLYHYRNGNGLLCDWPIVRMPEGPGIDEGTDLLHELRADGKIELHSETCGPYREVHISLTCDQFSALGDAEILAIKEAVAHVADRSAAELTNETHEHSRSWLKASDGEVLNIYLDVMDDEEYQKSASEIRKLNADLAAVFQ
jgi:hypothetical protein